VAGGELGLAPAAMIAKPVRDAAQPSANPRPPGLRTPSAAANQRGPITLQIQPKPSKAEHCHAHLAAALFLHYSSSSPYSHPPLVLLCLTTDGGEPSLLPFADSIFVYFYTRSLSAAAFVILCGSCSELSVDRACLAISA